MSPAVRALQKRWFPDTRHPAHLLKDAVIAAVRPTSRVLDLGCGRNAPMLTWTNSTCAIRLGIDPVAQPTANVVMLRGSADSIPLRDGSMDLVISQSVLEHLKTPDRAFREVARVLTSGGRWLILTPNFYDYASLIAWVIPDRFHAAIVQRTEGRAPEDTFPTYYKANTPAELRRLARDAGLTVARLELQGQWPSYLGFHLIPFLIGSVYARLVMAFDTLAILRPWIAAEVRKP